jgi:hypothetical protein
MQKVFHFFFSRVKMAAKSSRQRPFPFRKTARNAFPIDKRPDRLSTSGHALLRGFRLAKFTARHLRGRFSD